MSVNKLSAAELNVIIARLVTYPRHCGGDWGAFVRAGKLVHCHLSCFAPDQSGHVNDKFLGETAPQPVAHGDPAVQVAALRGDLSAAGIIAAYEDIKAAYGDAPGHRFSVELASNPAALISIFEQVKTDLAQAAIN